MQGISRGVGSLGEKPVDAKREIVLFSAVSTGEPGAVQDEMYYSRASGRGEEVW